MRGRLAVLGTLVGSLGLLAAACTGSTKRLIPPPPDTVARITTAPTDRDFSDVVLNPVEGRILTKSVEIIGGGAILSGMVTGPDGPVAGATVRLERIVGEAVARLDLVTKADGSWQAPQPPGPPTTLPDPLATTSSIPGLAPTIPTTTTTTLPPTTLVPTSSPVTTLPPGLIGGRYRIRAWRAPDLALTTPQILFVEAKQQLPVPLTLARYVGTTVSSLNAPDPPVVGNITSLTAVVTTGSVDDQGVVRAVPLAGAAVSLAVGSGWEFSGGPGVTNSQGRAVFSLRCLTVGASPIEVTVNGTQPFSLAVRACVAPPSTTTAVTVPGDPLGTVPGGGPVTAQTTTTTRRTTTT